MVRKKNTNLLPQSKFRISDILFVPTARLQLLYALLLISQFGAVGGFFFEEAVDGICGDGEGGWGCHCCGMGREEYSNVDREGTRVGNNGGG